ncbi:hypothetical protein [Streptomyces sp. NK08204]|nr:hypothetical protein [Streptomyces sp. NK08204]
MLQQGVKKPLTLFVVRVVLATFIASTMAEIIGPAASGEKKQQTPPA